MLDPDLDDAAAKIFFHDIKAQRNFKKGAPELSWWFIHELRKQYMAFLTLNPPSQSSKSKPTPPKLPPSKGNEEIKNDEETATATKPPTAVKQSTDPVPEDVADQLQELM